MTRKKSEKKNKKQNKKINFKIVKITNTTKTTSENKLDLHVDPYIEYLNNIKTI